MGSIDYDENFYIAAMDSIAMDLDNDNVGGPDGEPTPNFIYTYTITDRIGSFLDNDWRIGTEDGSGVMSVTVVGGGGQYPTYSMYGKTHGSYFLRSENLKDEAPILKNKVSTRYCDPDSSYFRSDGVGNIKKDWMEIEFRVDDPLTNKYKKYLLVVGPISQTRIDQYVNDGTVSRPQGEVLDGSSVLNRTRPYVGNAGYYPLTLQVGRWLGNMYYMSEGFNI